MQISWSAFRVNDLKSPENPTLDITSPLPLFQEELKSPAMMRYSRNIVRDVISALVSGQILVLSYDQPFYALVKIFTEHGLGGLHIELTVLKALGRWLDNSGWPSALVQAGIATSGAVYSFHKSSQSTRTRHAHHVHLLIALL